METPKLFIRTVVKKQHSIGNWGYSAAQAVEKRHEGESVFLKPERADIAG